VVYKDSITDLKDELQRRVTWYLTQPDKTVRKVGGYIKYYVDTQIVEQNAEIVIKKLNKPGLAMGEGERWFLEFKIETSVHNDSYEPVS
jgi:hypothetical protein